MNPKDLIVSPRQNSSTDGHCSKEPERFQSLQAGQYWRATQDIPAEGIDRHLVLLIQSIRWVDDAAHTIILRPHPLLIGKEVELVVPGKNGKPTKTWHRYSEHRFLLADFLRQFEFEPDHHRLRAGEVNQLQVKIGALQGELMEAQQNPEIMASVVHAGLLAQSTDTNALEGHEAALMPTSIAQALKAGITENSINTMKAVAQREHQVATIKADWITSKTTDIADTIKAMTPFYAEQAAAALAQTEDVRSYVANMMRGIESLDLYVGKNVEVETLREGPGAASDIPLTFVQQKVLMDEELAVWADVDETFDFSKDALFFEKIREHDDLINQIFPTERCVLVMAITRRDIEYGDRWANNARNAENKKVFLLIRNGLNIHLVRSPVESHLGAAKLFPSTDDQDNVFKGFDGTQTSFDDVTYTDALQNHELFALHFKRFLLLACGLDHRLKLFGEFYEGPPSFDFVSLPFQARYCRFLHEDNMLADGTRLSVSKWIAEKNAFMRSGSRVLCHWRVLMDPDTAPSACKALHHGLREGVERHYGPAHDMSVAIVKRSGDTLCVSVPVSGYSYSTSSTREFNCLVNITRFIPYRWNEDADLGFLCLDAVRPEEVHWYIHNRFARRDHMTYIRFFKQALKHLLLEQDAEAPTRQKMAAALQEGGIGTEATRNDIIQQTIAAWRALNRGKSLPRYDGATPPEGWTQLLDQMYMLAGEGTRRISEIEGFVAALGYSPLRLVLSGAATLAVYVAPLEAECDHRLEPHAWVHRITIARGKLKTIEKSRRWALLPDQIASESVLYEWDDAKAWAGRKSAFASHARKQEVLALASGFEQALQPFATIMSAEAHERHFQTWSVLRRQMLAKGKYVQNPVFSVPIGAVLLEKTQEVSLLCIATDKPHILLYRAAPNQEAREAVVAAYIRAYEDKKSAYETFHTQLSAEADWIIAEFEMAQAPKVTGYLADHLHEPRIDIGLAYPGLLQPRFAAWQKKHTKSCQVWLADGVLDAESELDIDRLLGLTVPVDFELIRLIELRLSADKESLLPYVGCMDIMPAAAKECDDYDPAEAFASRGYSRQIFTRNSPEKAHQFLASHAKRQNLCLIAAVDCPEWPQVPKGIERWYLITPEAASRKPVTAGPLLVDAK